MAAVQLAERDSADVQDVAVDVEGPADARSGYRHVARLVVRAAESHAAPVDLGDGPAVDQLQVPDQVLQEPKTRNDPPR